MSKKNVRQAELAGAWYPESPDGCLRSFEGFDAEGKESTHEGLRAAIVPHAGWVFSGRLAHNALRELSRHGSGADTLVLFGTHLGPRSGATVMQSGACWTPFGLLETDAELATSLLALYRESDASARMPLRAESAERHSQDNAVEVVLPLLKHFFADQRLLIVGAPPRAEILELTDVLIDAAKGLGRRLAFVGSTDLTHYGPNYGWSPRGAGESAERWVREVNDRGFLQRALTGDTFGLLAHATRERSACCPGAVAAAIHGALCIGEDEAPLPGLELCYSTSADVRPASSFVGYAGLVF